jgi:hypothetical protein
MNNLWLHYKGGIYRRLFEAKIVFSYPEHSIYLLGATLSEKSHVKGMVIIECSMGEIQMFGSPDVPNDIYIENSFVIIYASLITKEIWARPSSMWMEQIVLPSGESIPRFVEL